MADPQNTIYYTRWRRVMQKESPASGPPTTLYLLYKEVFRLMCMGGGQSPVLYSCVQSSAVSQLHKLLDILCHWLTDG